MQVHAFVAPKIIGGRNAPSPVGELGMVEMSQAMELFDVSYEQVNMFLSLIRLLFVHLYFCSAIESLMVLFMASFVFILMTQYFCALLSIFELKRVRILFDVIRLKLLFDFVSDKYIM